ncbi:LytTR family DNA-binding domain-containing protein [Ferruginibacter paludis]|uniref:LytR/AlgR family response regulator transcription factor n=1 Tax=Ferruginibacter paludis TaxID=1310417 RepID=UPI0025B3B78E|nr:LytTR family DNA-binding domain-containing protein [Ferruginibacter paludis]MDN3657836.1 LytTR family DNA-binding domain-containing protein [Ferruginibacter paludis]
MSLLKTIIIDDEPDSIALLQLQLQKYCKQVSLIGTYDSSVTALTAIKELQPDMLFLDIEMPELNGFQLLERLMPLQFNIVFVTAYNEYAIKAFRYNALDYLVKPILAIDLIDAVEKAAKNNHPTETQIGLLQKQINGEPIKKIAVSTQAGVSFISLAEIVYAEASGNYSVLIMDDGSKFIITKTLKDVQDLLEERHFFRIHRQFIINLNKVKHFNRLDYIITMDNKVELPVARVQKDKLLSKFGGL